MCYIAMRFVPRLLTSDQKQRRINLCLELREKANKDPTFTSISRIIMDDKSWIMVMIQKQSNSDHNGRAHNNQEQKRRGMTGVQ
jgi:hypothetical protein